MLEEFLMKARTYRMWAALAIGLFSIAFAILFSAAAVNAATAHNPKGLQNFALTVAELPIVAKELFAEYVLGVDPNHAAEQRFPGEAGFERRAAPDAPGAMLVLSRYDGDGRGTLIEYLDLDDGAVLHDIDPDIAAINACSKLKSAHVDFSAGKNPKRYMLAHPLPMDDGGVVFHGMYSPLVRLDACGGIVWTLDRVFHHSLERDEDGNIWGATIREPAKVRPYPKDFHDDSIAKVSPKGTILYEKSVSDLLIENGLRHYVYSRGIYIDNPLHLNDVQPVPFDGPFWKKGDLFLSIRHPSTVLLYRPDTNEVVWRRDGPWLIQHDVNIVSDHEISVFSNNGVYVPYGERTLGPNSEIIYDFATDTTREVFGAGFEKNDIRTATAGRGTILSSGDIFVEEQNYGRILQMGPDGDVRWRYVNRARNGKVFTVRWSRYLAPPEASELKQAVAKANCKSAAAR